MDLRQKLMSLQDEKYKEFSLKLNPGIDKIIGVRSPAIKSVVKEILKDDWRSFLDSADPEYLEEKTVVGGVISSAKMELDERMRYIEWFVPYIDGWAVCDSFNFKPKKDEVEDYWNFIIKYLDKPGEYEKRFGAVNLMKFIDDEHIDEILKLLGNVKHDGYYLKMGVAWSVSICFVKYPEKTMLFLKNNCPLDDFTYNKSLQKIIESFRVSDIDKKTIREMKRK